MKRFFILYLSVLLLGTGSVSAQVGEKVSSVKILNMNRDTINLPMLGKKNLLIFYADPSHPRQNKKFRDYFRTHPIESPEIDSYGIVNMAAAPLLPNSLILKMAKKEVAGTDAQLYIDPDNVLSEAWKLPGAGDNFTIIFVNKDKVIEFYKAGQLSQAEQDKVLALIKKYSK